MTNPPDAPSVPLALTGVVASGLPVDLGEVTAEPFYEVPAVFNRRPDSGEMDALRGATAHDRLTRTGYSEVTIDVRDRRLLIGHTNLGQLERGLASVIATIVDTVSRDALLEKARLRDAARTDSDERAARAQDVTRAASRIRFMPEERDSAVAVIDKPSIATTPSVV
jgi:hypothetical protein